MDGGEAAGLEVETSEVVFEVDVQPLAPGFLGVFGRSGDQGGAYAAVPGVGGATG